MNTKGMNLVAPVENIDKTLQSYRVYQPHTLLYVW